MAKEVAQTRLLVPDVNCGENAPYEHNPVYPPAPANELDLGELTLYAERWQDWAVDSDAVLAREQTKRRAVATCLANLRAQGLIN
jgi:hypothetical protein